MVRKIFEGNINKILEQNNMPKAKGRRREMMIIGCQLYALSEDDIVYIGNPENSLPLVESYYHRRITA